MKKHAIAGLALTVFGTVWAIGSSVTFVFRFNTVYQHVRDDRIVTIECQVHQDS